MPYYESVFIARQEISAQQVEALAENFAGVISEGGGTVTKTESWGLKSLAYRIKKNRKAHYTLFNIDGPAEAVHEMERQMRLHEDVLRYLTLRLDELEEGPSVQAQTRSHREDRDEGERPARVAEAPAEKSADKEAAPAEESTDKEAAPAEESADKEAAPAEETAEESTDAEPEADTEAESTDAEAEADSSDDEAEAAATDEEGKDK